MDALKDWPCAAGRQYEIEVALWEALANAVIHGCHDNPSAHVECELACCDGRELVIVVRDPGPGFDPASIANPVADENLYSPHGRGIYLIRHVVDEATFRRGGREVRMILRGKLPEA